MLPRRLRAAGLGAEVPSAQGQTIHTLETERHGSDDQQQAGTTAIANQATQWPWAQAWRNAVPLPFNPEKPSKRPRGQLILSNLLQRHGEWSFVWR